MKKIFKPSVEGPVVIAPRNDNGKRIYRAITDAARRLDTNRGCAQTLSDLLEPGCLAQRARLRDACERLMFSEPLLYGRKAQELLWRKGYYNVVSTYKKLTNKIPETDTALLCCHLDAGVGHYHHLLHRLQREFCIDLSGVLDFPLLQHSKDDDAATMEILNLSVEVRLWAVFSAHCCLVSLGDLSRYQVELGSYWDESVAAQYYTQAAKLQPGLGMPHNQLGTLSGTANHCLDAVYHYMRCMLCPQTFDGAENNLIRILERNKHTLETLPMDNILDPEDYIKRLVCRLLLLADTWFFNKTAEGINDICYKFLYDFRECLTICKPSGTNNVDDIADIETYLQASQPDKNMPDYLHQNIMLKLIMIILMCVQRLQEARSSQVSLVKAFTLAVFSEIVQTSIDHINEKISNFASHENENDNVQEEVEMESKVIVHINGFHKRFDEVLNINNENTIKRTNAKKIFKAKTRRRRRVRLTNSEESDITESDGSNDEHSQGSSDDDVANGSEYLSSDEDNNISDDDVIVESVEIIDVESQDHNGEQNIKDINIPEEKYDFCNKTKVDSHNEFVQNNKEFKPKRLCAEEILKITINEELLSSLKILCDWLHEDVDIIKSCAVNSPHFLQNLIKLFNLINLDLFSKYYRLKNNNKLNLTGVNFDLNNLREIHEHIPLPEDEELKAIGILENSQTVLDWDYFKRNSINKKEQSVLRVLKLVHFGFFLSKMKVTRIEFNRKKRLFVLRKPKVSKVFNRRFRGERKTFHSAKSANNFIKNSSESCKQMESSSDKDLMSHMGQLWLRSQVHDLESKVRRYGNNSTQFSPYVVVDAQALAHHSSKVRQFVAAQKFIVLVPSVVLSALDDLKHEGSSVREAIRWLEGQLQRGNRFLRTQRAGERASLPFVKVPKKLDRDSYIYLQIIEFCHYFIDQKVSFDNQAQSDNPAKCMVTLLMGEPISQNLGREISFSGLAQSAGINVEQIDNFFIKWKNSRKKQRRNDYGKFV